MSEDNETVTEEPTKAEPKDSVLLIHNMVRRQETRLQRATSPERHRMNLILGGGLVRVPRGRYVPVAKSLVKRMARELIEKEKLGLLKVTTVTQQRVDIDTLVPVEELPVSAPLPNPPLDSASNDLTFEHGVGNPVPNIEGGKGEGEEVDRPGVLDQELPDGDEEELEEEAEVPSDEPVDPAPSLEAAEEEPTPEASPEAPVEEPAVAAEDVTALANGLYENYTSKELVAIAESLELETSGNKKALAARLAEAGYHPPTEPTKED